MVPDKRDLSPSGHPQELGDQSEGLMVREATHRTRRPTKGSEGHGSQARGSGGQPHGLGGHSEGKRV